MLSVVVPLLKSKPPGGAAVVAESPNPKPGAGAVIAVGGTALLLNPKLLPGGVGAGVVDKLPNLKPPDVPAPLGAATPFIVGAGTAGVSRCRTIKLEAGRRVVQRSKRRNMPFPFR